MENESLDINRDHDKTIGEFNNPLSKIYSTMKEGTTMIIINQNFLLKAGMNPKFITHTICPLCPKIYYQWQ